MMSRRSIWMAMWALGTLLALPACSPREGGETEESEAEEESPAPAAATHAGGLPSVKLSPEEEERLGITTVAIQKRRVARSRTIGGEIVVPPGRRVSVAAPVAGKLVAAKPVATPGGPVSAGQPVFSLVPILTPEGMTQLVESRVSADGQIESAKVERDAARLQAARSEQLLADRAGSERQLQEAKARLHLAEAALAAAEAKRKLLDSVIAQAEEDRLTSVPIASPLDGIIEAVHVAAGQTVESGAPLFRVASLDPLWVRVPVYAGEAHDLEAPAGEVRVSRLGSAAENETFAARPVVAPPSADPASGTVDLFFEVADAKGRLRPGERVDVTFLLGEAGESLVAPWAAVVHDSGGGLWVYENPASHEYMRRRVEVRCVVGDDAVLDAGPAAGTKVVTAGAAELFGVEFGFGK